MSGFIDFTDYLNDSIIQSILSRNNIPMGKTNRQTDLRPLNLFTKEKPIQTDFDQEIESITKANNGLFDRINQNNEAIKLKEIENVKLQAQIDSKNKNVVEYQKEIDSFQKRIDDYVRQKDEINFEISKLYNSRQDSIAELEKIQDDISELSLLIKQNCNECSLKKKSNSEYFAIVADNNDKIEELENQRKENQRKENQRKEAQRKEIPKKEIPKKESQRKEIPRNEPLRKEIPKKQIPRDPLIEFKKSIIEVSTSKGIDVSSILNSFEELYKSIKDLSVNISLDKIPNGKYDLMIESNSQTPETKNKVSTFRSLFNMLNSMF